MPSKLRAPATFAVLEDDTSAEQSLTEAHRLNRPHMAVFNSLLK